MTRDFALIILAGVCVLATAALVATSAAASAVAPIVGIAGVALGRLGGPPPVKD